MATILSNCRFVHAPNSRAKLRVTRKMFLKMASYHQIMPSFLDFVFSFGTQRHANDFHFTGFRHDTRLSGLERGIAIPALDRSGRVLQLCYSLRSVETSLDQENWPWSIRGTATHHAFDFETGRANWLIVKGERGVSMKERIMTETSPHNGHTQHKFGSRDEAFSSSMSTHLLLCNWSAENWRWYINYMEEQVQAITRKTLSVAVAKGSQEPKPQGLFTRTSTGVLIPPKKTSTSKSLTTQKQQQARPSANMTATPPTGGPPGKPGPPPRLSALLQATNHNLTQPYSAFSFDDLQRIEYVEEHANAAILVITLNDSVLQALVKHYNSIMTSASCPHDLKTKSAIDFRRFVSRISHISAEMQMQKARVETLLRLLADRKALVCIYSSKGELRADKKQLYGILEYRNVEASKELTGKAQYSADNVEYMTQQMKQEAIFMRIITLVTLFFLPGTFVSVSNQKWLEFAVTDDSLQTLMSTDIIKWQTPTPEGSEKVVSRGAIEIFVAITLPFMFLTFSAAIGFYRWTKSREKKEMDLP